MCTTVLLNSISTNKKSMLFYDTRQHQVLIAIMIVPVNLIEIIVDIAMKTIIIVISHHRDIVQNHVIIVVNQHHYYRIFLRSSILFFYLFFATMKTNLFLFSCHLFCFRSCSLFLYTNYVVLIVLVIVGFILLFSCFLRFFALFIFCRSC
jgi:hypothetical protein